MNQPPGARMANHFVSVDKDTSNKNPKSTIPPEGRWGQKKREYNITTTAQEKKYKWTKSKDRGGEKKKERRKNPILGLEGKGFRD